MTKKKLGKCKECGADIWEAERTICDTCASYSKGCVLGTSTDNYPSYDSSAEDDWITEALLTTPAHNVHKFDWPD